MVSVVSDPLLIGIIAGAVIVLAIVAALYLKMRRHAAPPAVKTPAQKAGRLAYQPDSRPIPAVPVGAIPRPVQKTPPQPRQSEISLLNGRADITESLHALVEKYSLGQFTIATSDGLVFASSGEGSAQEDAAQFGGRYANDPHAAIPGIVLSGISHKGSDLVLIIRTPVPVPDEIRQNIENDTKDILNWWI
jgi:hypothetical protein